jgi:LDH2 family malate/lactate/ureidoglycolate dehydrogenase
MPRVSAKRLAEIGNAILVGANVAAEEAKTVIEHLVDASLAGHDSHGIITLISYIDRIKKKHIIPGAKWEIMQESQTTTVVDGHWGFGFAVTEAVTQMTIEKARTSNVAAATVFHQSHIGRLASYPLMAAREGMIGLITADSGRGPKTVVPFGGSEPRLGTNPMSIAVPSNLGGPFFFDMATSAVAAGKISVAVARGETIPTGWIMDSDGNATTDPTDFRGKGGALLPLGGSEGHKGYALGAMVEVLCGILTGLGFGVSKTGVHNDGCFLAVFNVSAFRPLEQFKQEVTDFAAFLKDTPPSKGSKGVLYPGEIEYLKEQERRRDGIDVESKTWNSLADLADEFGVSSRLNMERA